MLYYKNLPLCFCGIFYVRILVYNITTTKLSLDLWNTCGVNILWSVMVEYGPPKVYTLVGSLK